MSMPNWDSMSADEIAAHLRAQGAAAAAAVEHVLALIEDGQADAVLDALSVEQARRALVARFSAATVRWPLESLRAYVEGAELLSGDRPRPGLVK